jgi:hypothetical protein
LAQTVDLWKLGATQGNNETYINKTMTSFLFFSNYSYLLNILPLLNITNYNNIHTNTSVIVALPLYLQYSPVYMLIMQQQIQMKDNQICWPLNDGLYEILELNASEPIVFQRDSKNQQTYTEKNNQVILVVPKETGTRRF